MSKIRSPLIGGLLGCFLLILIGYVWMAGNSADSGKAAAPAEQAAVPSDAVTIKTLPPLYTLSGVEVPFEGRAELPLKITGRLAKELHIVGFQATGENAQKSAIRITWEDGGQELIPPGVTNLKLAPDRTAKQISVIGYSMHERRVFKDSSRTGTLSWEIQYSPVD
ncbi:MAG TPA: hypothetical protein PKA10_16130 [Selenomonadales bacterium]|nr:hypothetical protein [Selenomonadales bacterium]